MTARTGSTPAQASVWTVSGRTHYKAHGRGGREAGQVVLEAGDRLPEPGGSAAADQEEKAARAEPASGSKDKPGDSSGSTKKTRW